MPTTEPLEQPAGAQVATASLVRLYNAAFGRPPDDAGLSFWSGRLQNGETLVQVGSSFLLTPEFAERVGLGDEAFVAFLYQNLLGRPGEPNGIAFWTDRLASGVSRAQVLPEFAGTDEAERAAADDVAPAVRDTGYAGDPLAELLARMYVVALGRAPDAGGLQFWFGQAQAGRPLSDIADAFMATPEFNQRFGLDDAAFVTALFNNVLGRDPEPAAQSFWTGRLADGDSRGQVFTGIAESDESKLATEVLVAQTLGLAVQVTGTGAGETLNGFGGDDFLRGLGGDDLLDGGAGVDTLTGGAGRDTFRVGVLAERPDVITDFQLPSLGSARILAVGDSLTIGTGPSTAQLQPPKDQRFAAVLEQRLDDRGFDVEIVERAVPGSKTSDWTDSDPSFGGAKGEWIEDILGTSDGTRDIGANESWIDYLVRTEVDPGRVDGVVVELGTNDVNNERTPSAIRDDLAEIVDAFTSRGVPVLLAGIDPTGLQALNRGFADTYDDARKAELAQVYRDLASPQQVVALYEDFLEGVILNNSLTIGDRFHPNAAGVVEIVNRIEDDARTLANAASPAQEPGDAIDVAGLIAGVGDPDEVLRLRTAGDHTVLQFDPDGPAGGSPFVDAVVVQNVTGLSLQQLLDAGALIA